MSAVLQHVTPATVVPAYGLETKVNLMAIRETNEATSTTIYRFWDGVHGCEFDVWTNDHGIRQFEESGKRHWTKRDWVDYTKGMKWHRIQIFALRLRSGVLDWSAMEAAEILDEELGL